MGDVNQLGLDWLFVKRFNRLVRFLFPGCCSLPSTIFYFLLGSSLVEQYVIYHVGLLSGKFFYVLGSKDLEGFRTLTWKAVLYIAANVAVKSMNTYTSQVLYIVWRQILTKSIHRRYLAGIKYYQLNVLDGKIDNPDQRITQDVDKLCNAFSVILCKTIVVPFIIGYYIYQAHRRSGFIGPVAVFCFFLISTVLNKLIMSPVVRRVIHQESKEGDFRFKHMQIRVNAESLAMIGSTSVESARVNFKLDTLVNTQMSLINWQFFLALSVNMFDYLGSILSYLVLSVPIFAGKYDNLASSALSELISQNAFVCIYLMNSFSQLVDQFQQLTDVAGTTHRVGELMESLSKLQKDDGDDCKGATSKQCENLCGLLNTSVPRDDSCLLEAGASESTYTITREESINVGDPVYRLKEMTVSPPGSGRILFKDLTMDFVVGTNVLITGDSSCGKTTLVRVLRGLWQHNRGVLGRHLPTGPCGVFFLPQKPFFTDGTLRQQIVYPLRYDCMSAEAANGIKVYLGMFGLNSLLDRTGGLDGGDDWNWNDALSPGEMQRLSFIRLFYHKPRVAVLDEATSAVSFVMEDELYQECARLDITVISVGHRESLRKYHQKELHIDGEGGWQLNDIYNE